MDHPTCHFISPVLTLALSSSELVSASPGHCVSIALITPAAGEMKW
jgi:hypothetical protein